MPAPLYIEDAKPFSYTSAAAVGGTVLLNGTLESWTGELPELLAEHHLLKRDGAYQEPMGSGAAKFQYSCILYGGQTPDDPGDTRTPFARYRDLVQFFRANKRGTLTDPGLGTIAVAYAGMSEAVKPLQEGDAVLFTLRFAEDQIDVPIGDEPTVLAANATAAASSMQSGLSALAQAKAALAPALTLAGTIYTLAASFLSTALAAYNAYQLNPGLLGALGAVLGSCQSMGATLQQVGLVGVSAAPYTQAARTVAANCVNLYNLVHTQGAQYQILSVPSVLSLSALCASLYGGALARSRLQEILSLNPSLRSPQAIPAGFPLLIPVPGS